MLTVDAAGEGEGGLDGNQTAGGLGWSEWRQMRSRSGSLG